MAIGRKKQGEGEANKAWAALTPSRVYTDTELRDFHKKIQKFYKDKTLSTGEQIKVLDQEEFAVAFGAYTKTVVGKSVYYRAAGGPNGNTDRLVVMYKLLEQYDDWRRKQDWIDNERLKELDLTANAITV